MPSPNLDELATTSLRNRRKSFRDNFSKSTALWARMKENDNFIGLDGGRTIVEELYYAENSNFTFYSDYEVLPTAATEGISAAEYEWKSAACAFTISGMEKRKNSGKNQIKPLFTARMNIAEKTMINNLGTYLYQDGSGFGGKAIGGLQAYVSTSPSTGTVGGINAATYSFWRNVYKRSSVDFGGAATNATIQSHMNRVYLDLVRNREKPDLIVTDNTSYRLYLESLQAQQRFVKTDIGKSGFDELAYMSGGTSVVMDGGYQGGCPANYMYFLNTEYIKLYYHNEMYMDVIDGERKNSNQDAIVKIIGFMGNLVIGNRFMQAVLRVD